MNAFWIDAHCHLTDARYSSEALADTLAQSEEAGIQRWFLGGVDPEEWQKQREILGLRPGRIYRSVGLHPWWVARSSTDTIQKGLTALERELAQSTDQKTNQSTHLIAPVHAIGELGLDASSRVPEGTLPLQADSFRAQIQIAQKHSLPLVLHVVRAHDQALKILKTSAFTRGGLVHSYSGSFETAQEYLRLGFLISLSSTVTHPGREKLAHVIARLPPEGFVLESDCPDQPPADWPTPLNSPHSILPLAQKIAHLRDPSGNTPASVILDQSTRNLERVFHL